MTHIPPLRILIVGDVSFDAIDLKREMGDDPPDITPMRASTRAEFVSALREFRPDLVLTEFRLSGIDAGFDGLEVLQLTQAHNASVPVLIVTNPNGEETAVACMKAGAADYILKQHIDRLPGAVQAALAQRQDRLGAGAAPDALRESEARYQSLVQTLPDAVTMTDGQGRITYVSPAALEFWQYAHESEALGRSVLDWVHPNQRERAVEAIHIVLEGNTLRNQEFVLLRTDGTSFVGELSASCRLDTEGRPFGLVIVVRDITARKQAEEALRDSEQRFQTIFRTSPASITITRLADDRFAYVNDAFTTVSGYTSEEAIGHTSIELNRWVRPEERARLLTLLRETGRVVDFEAQLRHKSGAVHDVLVSAAQIELSGEPYLLSLTLDVSEHKRAIAALQDSQHRLSEAQRVAHVGDWEWDIPSNTTTWSDEAHRLYGHDPAQPALSQEEFMALAHPDDRDKIQAVIQRLLLDPQPSECEFRITSLNGQTRWVHERAEAIVDASGQPIRIRGTVQDITARKRASEALRASEAKFRSYIEHAPLGIFVVDRAGRYVEVNPASARMFGYTEQELLELSIPDLLTPKYREAGLSAFQTLAQTGFASAEFRMRRKDGTEIWSTVDAVKLPGDRFMAFCQDITERKQADQMLKESEARFRTLLNKVTNIAVQGYGPDGVVRLWNEASHAIYGYTADEAIGRNLVDLIIPPEMRDGVQAAIQHMIASAEPQPAEELWLMRKDGSLVPVYSSHTVIDVRDHERELYCIDIDLTERKQAEAALREMSENMAAAQRMARFGSWEAQVTDDLRFVEPQLWSDECYRMFGFEPRSVDVTHEFLMSRIHPDDRDRVVQAMSQSMQDGQARSQEYRIVRPDGAIRFIHAQAILHLDEHTGRPAKVIGTMHDITERKQAEERLIKVAEMAPGALCSFRQRPDGSVTLPYASPIWEDIHGLRREELMIDASPIFQRMHPADIGHVTETISESARSLSPWRDEYRFRHPVKGEIWLEGHSTPEVEPDGSLIWHGFITDITDRKRTEQALRDMADSMTAAQRIAHFGNWTIELTPTQEFVEPFAWSDECYRTFGFEPGTVEVTSAFVLGRLHPDDREPALRAALTGVQERAGHSSEYRIVLPDGTVRHIHEQGKVILDAHTGQPTKLIGAVHDITERKQAEEAIRALNADLERRVAERTARLAAANEEMEAFTYSVSHDLRAPLRAIDGFSRIVMEEHAEVLGAEGDRLLRIIRTNAQRMDRLITDLLTLSRLTRSEMRATQVDMAVLASAAFDELATPEDRQTFRLSVGALPPAYGDPSLLRQIWNNLLSNAIKYTRPCDNRRIDIGGYEEGMTHVYFVKDSGVGFDMAYADKLFGAFQRLHKAEEFEGTGVGLATVKRIVHRHGGRVWAEGRVNQGATFFFTLPKEAEA